MNNKKENKRTSAVVVCLVCVVVIIMLYVTGIGCLFKYATGVSCPACGITRAYVSLLRGDILGAFRYHPLFWLAPVVCLSMFEDIQPKYFGENKRLCRKIIYILGSMFILVYIIRLFVIKDDIIVVDISSGVIGKVVNGIRRMLL